LTPLRHSVDNNDKFQRTNTNPKLNKWNATPNPKPNPKPTVTDSALQRQSEEKVKNN